jgi:glycosyltransferase involved in cell wall biosynthesis
MKILVISPVYYPESFCVTPICEDLVNKGDTVHVLTGLPNYGLGKIFPGYNKPGLEKHNGVLINRVKIHPRRQSTISIVVFYLSLGQSLLRYVRKTKEHYDLVLSFCLSPLTATISANYYAKKHKVPHVHYCLDVWPESIVEAGYLKKRSIVYLALFFWCKTVYSKIDRLLISSPSFSPYFTNEMKIPKNKIFYFPQPINVKPRKGTPVQYSTKYTFVYAGNIGKLQQIEKIVEACLPFSNNRDFSFHILGKGSELQNIRMLIQKLNLGNTVFYDGFFSTDTVESHLINATALIVSLKNDGTVVSKTIPNKLSSYLAVKKPILGIIGGDGKDLIDRIGAGLSCDDKIDSISKSFIYFMEMSEAERDMIGQRNLDFFNKHFSFKNLMNTLSEHLSEAVSFYNTEGKKAK